MAAHRAANDTVYNLRNYTTPRDSHICLLRLVSIIHTVFVQHTLRNVTTAYPSPEDLLRRRGPGRAHPHTPAAVRGHPSEELAS